MIIKQPFAPDVSHWKIVPDFASISPRPLLALTKATEHTSFVDDTFIRYFADMRQDGVKRGCYHFFRKYYNATEQARHFCATIHPYVNDDDILILDFEEGGETATQLIAFLAYVKTQYPRNLIMNYSRKGLMDAVSMTETQKAIMRQYPVWTAGYPTNPDLYSTVPSFYVPDQTRWGPVWLWQYTSHGQVTGISGDVDCNWMHPDLVERLSGTVIPPPPIGEAMIGKVLVGLNIRKTTNTTYDPIGQLAINDIVEGTRLDSGWWKLSKWTRNGAVMTLPAADCYAYEGATQGYIQEVVTPPTPTFPPRVGLTFDGTTIRWYVAE